MIELYKDVVVEMFSPEKPATKGHVRLAAIDNLSPEDFAHVLSAASFASNALFEQLGAHGSNILLSDIGGVHADVLLRTEGDEVGLHWTPTPGDQQELEEVAAKIKDRCDYIDVKQSDRPIVRKEQKPMPQQDEEEEGQESSEKKVTNYLLKKLDRIP